MLSQLLYSELEETIFPAERQFHVLKHFKKVDAGYVQYLQDNSQYTPGEITKQLDVRGSDFYEGFAPNPIILWQNLLKTIRVKEIEASWIDTKCEIEVDFTTTEYQDGIGEDHLIQISELPAEVLNNIDTSDWKSLRKVAYSTRPKSTWKVQVIIRKMENSPEVISIFPGIYAPQLPDKELQDDEDFARSVRFWCSHVVLKS